MTQIILYAVVIACGLLYALKPKTFLARKYRDEEVPEMAVRTARISGVFVALVGALLLLNSL